MLHLCCGYAGKGGKGYNHVIVCACVVSRLTTYKIIRKRNKPMTFLYEKVNTHLLYRLSPYLRGYMFPLPPRQTQPLLISSFHLPSSGTALVASVFTLTVISIGRFVAVMFPLHARTSPDRAIRVIAAVWIASALISSPPLLYRKLYKTEVSLEGEGRCVL